MVKNTPIALYDNRVLPNEKSTELLIIVTSEYRAQRTHTSAKRKDGRVENNESHGLSPSFLPFSLLGCRSSLPGLTRYTAHLLLLS